MMIFVVKTEFGQNYERMFKVMSILSFVSLIVLILFFKEKP